MSHKRPTKTLKLVYGLSIMTVYRIQHYCVQKFIGCLDLLSFIRNTDKHKRLRKRMRDGCSVCPHVFVGVRRYSWFTRGGGFEKQVL